MTANAGVLKHWDSYAKPEDFFDWNYAQQVWFEMNTWEAEEKEWAKYESDFRPWLALYKKDKRKALAELKTYPKGKRRNIERGHDIQLAYDQWFDQVYRPWFNSYAYEAARALQTKKKAKTFDDSLALWSTFKPCVPARFLNQCGPIPDWRSEKWKAKEEAMMRKVADELAAKDAKKK